MHLTSKCNLRCPYCYNQEQRHQLIQLGRQSHQPVMERPHEPNTEKLLRVLEEAAELGFRQVKLTGGEALLNKDTLLIAARAKELGLMVNLLTNATLIDEALARKIADTVDTVSISLDSDKPEEHDAVRGKGTHAQVLKAINLLKEKGVKHLHLNAVITPVNLASVSSFLDFAWNQLKADEVSVAANGLEVDDPRRQWRAGDFKLKNEQYAQVYKQQREFLQIQNARSGTKPAVSANSLFRRHCGVGNGLISLESNGDIYPCQTLHRPEFLIGNAFIPGTLRRIFAESSPVLKRMLNANVDFLPECNTCPVRYVCAGGCRSEAYTNEGDILARNRAQCSVMKQMALDQMWDAATIPYSQMDAKVAEYRAARAARVQ